MEFNCDRFRNWRRAKREAKRIRNSNWHARFVIFPRKVAPGKCIWLGYVMFKKTEAGRGASWCYKEPGSDVGWNPSTKAVVNNGGYAMHYEY